MSTEAPPDWLFALIPAVWLVGFPLLWLSVMFLLSRISGWSTLAHTYKEQQPFAGEVQRRCSGTLGFVGYNKSLVLGANEQGLHISVPKIFVFGHPALFVPWSDVRASRKRRFLIPTVGFELGRAPSITLRVHRRFSDKLESDARENLRIAPEPE